VLEASAMGTSLVIASVTAVLKSLLENRLIQQDAPASVGDVSVTALPPDRITIGADERSQLNLFLYRVTPNTRWRRAEAAGSGNGHQVMDGAAPRADESPPTPPPLALDLHYLVTAYGEHDLHAEILLGYAMQLLHEIPVLTREQIESALASANGSSSVAPAALAALASSGLADQVEQIGVTPEFTNTDEMSRLWSALQARYRPSASYKVAAVVVDTHDTHDARGARQSAASAGRSASPARRR
ncbi:MAG TPA: DUF4255 domain-containing protein, partial [Chloroflexota bacterium]|nr:DUF4255 domain-containing protein [Chloroflexota bacterium]